MELSKDELTYNVSMSEDAKMLKHEQKTADTTAK